MCDVKCVHRDENNVKSLWHSYTDPFIFCSNFLLNQAYISCLPPVNNFMLIADKKYFGFTYNIRKKKNQCPKVNFTYSHFSLILYQKTSIECSCLLSTITAFVMQIFNTTFVGLCVFACSIFFCISVCLFQTLN